MSSTISSPLEIETVPPEGRAAALHQVFGWEEESARRRRIGQYFEVAASDPATFKHLLHARRGERRLGYIWGQILPGKLANVWPQTMAPVSASAESILITDALQSTLDQRLGSAGVQCGQVLLPIQAAVDMGYIERHGYRLAACFAFLGCDLSQAPAAAPQTELKFEPFQVDQLPRLARLMEATYEKSLDVPAMNGVRKVDDVLEGYRGSADFTAPRWYVVMHGDHDVGCLLLSDHAGAEHWELVYMGLIPQARGKGWGVEITRFAQWLAAQAGRRALVLGVDTTNYPALWMYGRCGFEELERRIVYLKRFF